MKRVVGPPVHGCEEVKAVTAVDILHRAGISVIVARVEAGTPPGAGEGLTGVKLSPDMSLDGVKASDFDMVVLPVSLKEAETLRKDPRVARLLRSFQGDTRGDRGMARQQIEEIKQGVFANV